ncbi:uracil-DNA glycosylase-like [Argopecten irradians]|uniref:uracil-DNA glycosylase-like n=1 Tax=Argopecten irradians TaxID=31199 RepID=UPI0037162A2D
MAENSQGLLVNFGDSWKNALEEEFSKDYFQQLTKFVEAERKEWTIYPPEDQVFSWTQYCTPESVKVVILGQDPYPGKDQAHGLCFSVPKGVKPPPSLEKIYEELKEDIEGFKHPGHGTLIGWAEQGVLLLNSCLTVRQHQTTNLHKDKGWEKFTDAVISYLNKNTKELVFILWGSYAKEKGDCIETGEGGMETFKVVFLVILTITNYHMTNNVEKHYVLECDHPSPRALLSPSKENTPFKGCQHFSKCNTYLTEKGKTPIDWKRLPPQD